MIYDYANQIAPLDAELILAHIIGKPREYILAHPDIRLDDWQQLGFKRLVKQRACGVPLAYLTGHKEFFGLDFLVNRKVLIPRPETELMVELTLERLSALSFELSTKQPVLKADSRPPIAILIDVGTGTGCIPIAILKTIKHKNIKAFGIDISPLSLRIATKNAKRHHADIAFLHGNLLEPFLKSYQLSALGFQLIITANLPYLTQEQYYSESSIQPEPKSALVADNGGLALYEQLLKQIQLLAHSCQLSAVSCFFEIDPAQSIRITNLIKHYFPTAVIEIKRDLAGRDRVVQTLVSNF